MSTFTLYESFLYQCLFWEVSTLFYPLKSVEYAEESQSHSVDLALGGLLRKKIENRMN